MGKKRHRLAAGELEILEMLWREGPVSLSGAHESLERSVGYTTVQTRLNRLVRKQIVSKSETRPALYKAAVSKALVCESDLELLLQRVSNGKILPLVAHLVQDRKLSADEISSIRKMIDEAEQQSTDQSGSKRTRRKRS